MEVVIEVSRGVNNEVQATDGRATQPSLHEELNAIMGSLNKRNTCGFIAILIKKVSHLQRELKKFAGESDEICVKEIHEMAKASLSVQTTFSDNANFASNCSNNVTYPIFYFLHH